MNLHTYIILAGTFCCVIPIKVIRDHTKDVLSCPDQIICSMYDAQQLDDKDCTCIGGSFVQYQNRFVCQKKIIRESDCEFHFEHYENSYPSISVYRSLADDFDTIVSNSTRCSKMAIVSIDVFNVGLRTWLQLSKRDFAIIKSRYGTFSVKWEDPFNVDKELYAGQLIKFNFDCSSSSVVKKTKSSFCVIGKIIGQRNWTDSSKICMQGSGPPKPTKMPSPNGTDDNEDDGMEMALIGAIVAGILIVVIIILILVFCRKKNYICRNKGKCCCHQRKKKPSSASDIKLTPTSEYAEPSEVHFDPPLESPSHFENKSYLTALRGNNLVTTNNNKNYENIHPDEIYSYEETNPMVNSTNDYEHIAYEEPDKVIPQETYTTLTTSEQPEYHALSLKTTDNDYYESMTSNPGTI